ncbi:hypothetical protein HYH03_014882 [Edaphochlamys debaryana]|uniref:BZIP domain-containing protein n=1 Tax=Edaphochlamys debaryana TaxID=47281 RepID=A0A835XMZ7_9CHLO|nr:hypothetical protein HYH03_014882 [Edaphochlamys debaryana]|eukprot:KAG2486435.1 hypothetical protein HYH03_014882 [Edaphochlamys debaryana]
MESGPHAKAQAQLPPGASQQQPDSKLEQPTSSLPPGPSLTASQRGELELAKQRAEKAKAATGRKTPAPSGGARRGRAMSQPVSDDDDDDDDGDELGALSPDEQERRAGGTDKDARRLKRLLRNRVSAQQARERKKAYVVSLEDQVREQQEHIAALETRVEAVEGQNTALRNIIRTMRGFADAPAGPQGAAPPAGPAAAAPGAGAGGGGGPPPPAAAAGAPQRRAGQPAQAPSAANPAAAAANPAATSAAAAAPHPASAALPPQRMSASGQIARPQLPPPPQPVAAPAAAAAQLTPETGLAAAAVPGPHLLRPHPHQLPPSGAGPNPHCLSMRPGVPPHHPHPHAQPHAHQQHQPWAARGPAGLGAAVPVAGGGLGLEMDVEDMGDAGVVPPAVEVWDSMDDL